MKHIEINILQFLALLIFIFLFTYFWLPKTNIKKTTEYRKLALQYIQIIDERNYWQKLYMQQNFTNNNNNNYIPSESFNIDGIGTKNSAHSNIIMPRNININDNEVITKFFN